MPWLVIGPDPELRISGKDMILINEWARSESSTRPEHFHSIEVANFQIHSPP